ncbi:MAG: DUF2252 domain-containing protein [Mycetocola sp.]
MTTARTATLSTDVLPLEQRVARGRAARTVVPRSRHAAWEPLPSRPDPVGVLEEQAQSRIPELVPIRYGRMLVSPFSYFRGAAAPMAADLATTPTSGLVVQACGDAHLSNFGMFGSAERRLVFDINDFDETAPGPWEWDVKRLAASLEIAARENDFPGDWRDRIVRRAMRSYRKSMREFADRPMLEVWYARLDMDDLLPRFRSLHATKTPAVWRAITKARAKDSLQAFRKLCHTVDGVPRIISNPPLITPVEELREGVGMDDVVEFVRSYGQTLPPDRLHLLEQYQLVHLARKVVGVGSVGTEAWILLLVDGHGTPLFLQIKEAGPSVLEPATPGRRSSHQGERVVRGQRLMQATGDIFLGWERFAFNGREREYYVRQLCDWKGSADVGRMTPEGMELWARMAGWTLARAHARSGDRHAIAAYLGRSDVFDGAIARFSVSYADQNERDYERLREAVACGRLEATTGV